MTPDKNLARWDLFRWKSALLWIVVVAAGLAAAERFRAAGGVVLGLLLYLLNVLLLLEIGRSLLRGGTAARPGLLAAVSSAGRLLLQAVLLSGIALTLGRDAVLGACGGVLIAQVNLHVSGIRHRREDR